MGFVELHGKIAATTNGTHHADGDLPSAPSSDERLTRRLEQSWPILEHLKSQNAENLFKWIGNCIATVVQAGCKDFGLSTTETLPLGVTFSFPIEQETISDATLMGMGKGFAIQSKLDLGSNLIQGYENVKPAWLPPLRVAAIANAAVSGHAWKPMQEGIHVHFQGGNLILGLLDWLCIVESFTK